MSVHAQRLRDGEVVRGTAADGGKDGDCKGTTEKRWSRQRIECSSLVDNMHVCLWLRTRRRLVETSLRARYWLTSSTTSNLSVRNSALPQQHQASDRTPGLCKAVSVLWPADHCELPVCLCCTCHDLPSGASTAAFRHGASLELTAGCSGSPARNRASRIR